MVKQPYLNLLEYIPSKYLIRSMLYVECLSIFEQGDKVLKQVGKRAIFK